jgi:hypothetical protein
MLQENPDFDPRAMGQASRAAQLLCQWFHDSVMAFELSVQLSKKELAMR